MCPPYKVKRCILRESNLIRQLLAERWQEVGIMHKEVVEDARENGVLITKANLSRYVHHGNVRSALDTHSIMWLCERWGINLELKVSKDKNFSIFK